MNGSSNVWHTALCMRAGIGGGVTGALVAAAVPGAAVPVAAVPVAAPAPRGRCPCSCHTR